ncbi:MAG: NAD-dependent epimerase/dehydratase family protein [Candidatus Omnitrophica bacterium]|nr:NAD-dependent epimerase/dehydratase family protein [Candidatus Omnitrophota bacterium]
MSPRALVLGATGHIGAHVVRALLADGHPVRAAYHNPRFLSVLEGLPIERVQVDLERDEELSRALEGYEWVFDAAGYYPRIQERRAHAIERGIASVNRLMRSLLHTRPSRVVFTSSAATIRQVPGRLANETDAEPWSPRHGGATLPRQRGWFRLGRPQDQWRPLYATVKIAMEHEALRFVSEGLPIVVVNPSLCVGEYDAHRFSGRAVLAFAKYRLPCYLDYVFNAVYTGDVGVGHVRAAEQGRIGERYLLSCQQVRVRDFARLVATIAGVSPPRWESPRLVAHVLAWGSELVAGMTRREPWLPRQVVHLSRTGQRLDNAKALRELHLPQTPIDEAIRRAIGWFRQEGILAI